MVDSVSEETNKLMLKARSKGKSAIMMMTIMIREVTRETPFLWTGLVKEVSFSGIRAYL
jgi:hypothetical protein